MLAAEEAAGIQALRLIDAQDGVELVAVLTGTPSGTSRGVAVADVAQRLGYSLLPAERVCDASYASWLQEERIDMLINVHALYIIHRDVIEAPIIGSFNLHPGPLPGYAGLNAPSWAIFNGEERHAVTLHWMAAGVDTGAIAYDAWIDLGPDATGLSCSLQCMRQGVPLIQQLLATALQDRSKIPVQQQANGERVFYKKGDVPFGGKIDWGQPATRLDAFIRAADYHPMPSPWGHPEALLNGRSLDVVKVQRTGRAVDTAPGMLAMGEAGCVEVATGDEWLIIKRIQQDGRVLSPTDLLEIGRQFEASG
ncbi:MAG: methionyl-tRNA formyltransferase [Geminicoccaceae bacterium]